MKINIRNMVCRHCVEAVERILAGLGLDVRSVELGVADIACPQLSDSRMAALDAALLAAGFERVVSPDEILVERTRRAIIDHVRSASECRLNLSACLESHLGVPYDAISRTFSALEGRTIEKYQIAQKVEWVKEMMGYGDMTLSEIADRADYSSVAHLSRQFKAVTGLTPTQYMALPPSRTSLSEV